jgi:hypothetical protein
VRTCSSRVNLQIHPRGSEKSGRDVSRQGLSLSVAHTPSVVESVLIQVNEFQSAWLPENSDPLDPTVTESVG